MKRNNNNFIIIFVFAIVLYLLCIYYNSKYQETNKELLVTQNELSIAYDCILDTNKYSALLEEQLATANMALNDLKSEEYELVYMGDFKLTAYCSCEICCEEWALNRPKDEYGNSIVYTATGTIAKQGRTIGVDPKLVPYGTEVYIEGQGWFVAEDTGAINGRHIDIYMDSHEAALSSGVTHGGVWILLKRS